MKDEERISDLKGQIKKAKQENKPYKVIEDLTFLLQEEMNKGTLKGAFNNMRKATADAFYRTPENIDKKKAILDTLRKSIKDIEAIKE